MRQYVARSPLGLRLLALAFLIGTLTVSVGSRGWLLVQDALGCGLGFAAILVVASPRIYVDRSSERLVLVNFGRVVSIPREQIRSVDLESGFQVHCETGSYRSGAIGKSILGNMLQYPSGRRGAKLLRSWLLEPENATPARRHVWVTLRLRFVAGAICLCPLGYVAVLTIANAAL